jgi:hypothetical protein
LGTLLALGAVLLVAGYWWGLRPHGLPLANVYLSLMLEAYLGSAFPRVLFLGLPTIRTNRLPLLFLGFTIPWPTAVVDGVATVLQRASTEVAHAFLILSGLHGFRDCLCL